MCVDVARMDGNDRSYAAHVAHCSQDMTRRMNWNLVHTAPPRPARRMVVKGRKSRNIRLWGCPAGNSTRFVCHFSHIALSYNCAEINCFHSQPMQYNLFRVLLFALLRCCQQKHWQVCFGRHALLMPKLKNGSRR